VIPSDCPDWRSRSYGLPGVACMPKNKTVGRVKTYQVELGLGHSCGLITRGCTFIRLLSLDLRCFVVQHIGHKFTSHQKSRRDTWVLFLNPLLAFNMSSRYRQYLVPKTPYSMLKFVSDFQPTLLESVPPVSVPQPTLLRPLLHLIPLDEHSHHLLPDDLPC